MNPLYIVLFVCPIAAATPQDCVIGFEDPLVPYEGLEKMHGTCKELYREAARDLYQAGAAVRISCVNKDIVDQMKEVVEKVITYDVQTVSTQ